ncbi:MAG: dienelactone hydrolase [Herbaspirillum sp.]|nr:dienelactone hydrolase [Herbaspirillum sp.]
MINKNGLIVTFRATAKALLCCLIAGQSVAAPPSALSNEKVERIEFDSVTPKGRFEMVRHTGDNKPVKVFGDLIMPTNTTGPVPAVVISHGSDGVGPALYDVWAAAFVKWGYAAFIVDSFTPRGISSTGQDQSMLDPMANVADAINALKLLAADPRIDKTRIANIGFSRGGGVAIDTYFDMYRHGILKDDLKFAANIPVYPNGCNVKYRTDWANTNHAPMLMLLAEKDDSTPAKDCVAYADELNAADGLNIQYKIYQGAYHGFDGHSQYHMSLGGESGRNCDMEVKLTDVPGSGLGEAIDKKTGQPIIGFDAWGNTYAACRLRKGYIIEGNPRLSAEAVHDVQEFLKATFAK